MNDREVDPMTLEVMCNQFESIAEEMEQVLITSSYSPNIEERRDCSTALFNAGGRLVAQAEHVPVHLDAMPEAVGTILDYGPEPGDVFVLNDPFEGKTHLPDVTMVSPLSVGDEVLGYAISRAHHADVGGMMPGSMLAGAREIYQEGLRLPPVRLVTSGEINDGVLPLLLANARNPGEHRADIRAQPAADKCTEERLADLVGEHDQSRALAVFDAVMNYSRNHVTAELRDLPNGEYRTRGVLEDDGVTDDDIPVEVTATVDGDTVTFDFGGTADQVAGNVNVPLTVAKSVMYFAVRYVTDPEIPPSQGCYDPISIEIPDGSFLNPDAPTAVVGGNVKTSQRVTGVASAALADATPERVPAQGQGTISNLTIGNRIGSSDGFTYYETIDGGSGGHVGGDGMDGVQVGMTNTLNTPVETLEAEYPFFVEAHGLREGSSGRGEFRGGLDIVRSVTVETDTTVSLLTEHRRVAPHGIADGENGATEQNLVDGEAIPSKTTCDMPAGTTVTVRTPGSGGYGDPDDRDADARRRDREDGKAK